MKVKTKLVFIISVVISLIAIEVFLRQYYGFTDNILIREDPDYEYIAQANQYRFRFRNHVSYNSKSMRSEDIDTSAQIILGFGDSVINGGTLTDQDSLATTILSDSLSKIHQKKIQFLNISAGSWGPDNNYAYLEKHGDFGAKSIFLFVSSHDAYDTMDFEKIVDVNKSYQSEQYLFALYELIDRYLLPRAEDLIKKFKSDSDNFRIKKEKKESKFNTGFTSFIKYSEKKNISLVIYLHPEKEELIKGSYNDQGDEIIKLASKNNIPLIFGLNNGFEKSDYRDGIHLNSNGQKKLARIVLKYMDTITVFKN